uniref:THAP-type domain-containing protein n=1 Tax=Sinocyclocheilus anshuiensis TaxID=1608454 RepID=A0A671KNU9_9TELE
MEISCVYPGCFNIKKPKRKFSLGNKFFTFHRFPIHNPERLKLWLLALHLDINTPEHALIFKRVCSDNFFDDDFKPSQQGNRRFLKASAVPNTFLQQTEPLSSTSTSAPSTEDEECEMHWKQIKWIVNEPNVMDLFKRCQECGSVITKTRKATVGSVLRVHWECEKNHKGKWSSCTDVRGMPANNLLVSACTLFTGQEIKIDVLTTDRSTSIRKIMHVEYPNIHHEFDI